jgi:hypothetical protein
MYSLFLCINHVFLDLLPFFWNFENISCKYNKMKNKDQILLEELCSKILNEERNVPPVGWDKGFEFPMKIGSGGKEIPFKKNGKWYLYVWDSKNNKHFYYCYDDDIYYPDTDFDKL